MSSGNCELCGEPMPPGETMFKYHGYSGPCPKPPLKHDVSPETCSECRHRKHEALWCQSGFHDAPPQPARLRDESTPEGRKIWADVEKAAASVPDGILGTYVCRVCGKDEPHRHEVQPAPAGFEEALLALLKWSFPDWMKVDGRANAEVVRELRTAHAKEVETVMQAARAEITSISLLLASADKALAESRAAGKREMAREALKQRSRHTDAAGELMESYFVWLASRAGEEKKG